MCSLVDWTWLKLPKLKKKEEKKLKTSRTEYPRTVGQLQSVPTHSVTGIPKGEEKQEQKKYLKQS